jgi:hypothetical protein
MLDENLPIRLATAIGHEGHFVETVKSLRLAGVDNGALYALAVREFDFFFTRDAHFAKRARESKPGSSLKLRRVTLHQKPQAALIEDFMTAFRCTDWPRYSNGDDWP